MFYITELRLSQMYTSTNKWYQLASNNWTAPGQIAAAAMADILGSSEKNFKTDFSGNV